MSESKASLLVTCENCGHKFPAEKAMLEQLEAQARASASESLSHKHQEDLDRQRAALEKESREKLAEEQKRSREAVQREAEKLKRAAEDSKLQTEEAERLKLEAEAGRKATLEARKKESELAQKLAENEIKQEEWKADQSKKMVQEVRAKAEALAAQRQESMKIETDAKLKEREDQIQRMQEQIRVLSQKLQSQDNRTVGEGQEMDLEAMLTERFRHDVIAPVPKGERGADIIQTVQFEGRAAGTILWESKKTQAFQAGYVEKLRADMAENKADQGVLVSVTFPATHKDATFFPLKTGSLLSAPGRLFWWRKCFGGG